MAESFNKEWNFPHCIGALDGRHITMESPINSGSEYSNHKQSLSIVLITLVDAQYCFTFVDCGCHGRVGDGAVYQRSKLFQKIVKNELHTPSPEPLPGRTKPVPYVIVADDAFEFSPILMKPYQEKHNISTKERVFNYRLSRARRIAENTFGILASVFRVLRKPMLLQPEKVTLITMTCVLLHNFLRRSRTSHSIYTPPGTFDREENGEFVPGVWRQDRTSTSLLPITRLPSKPKTNAEAIRIEFSDYFVTDGKVPGQDRYS